MTSNLINTLIGDNENLMITHDEIGVPLHPEVISPFIALKKAMKTKGIQLRAASGFRSYQRQLFIFNKKASGQAPLLDENGNHLDFIKLSNEEILFAILRWSALPGLSRHHWGSEIDIFDLTPIQETNYKVQLVASEYDQEKGIFKKLSRFLEDEMIYGDNCHFFRPYAKDLGGVGLEPWHISYKPLASEFYSAMDLSIIEQRIKSSDILLKEEILHHLPFIFDQYFLTISPS